MYKQFLISASFLGALSVILGAFAAHKLKNILSPDSLQTFETAVKYQMYHALAVLAVGLVGHLLPAPYFLVAPYTCCVFSNTRKCHLNGLDLLHH